MLFIQCANCGNGTPQSLLSFGPLFPHELPYWSPICGPFFSAPNNEQSGKYVIIHFIAIDAAGHWHAGLSGERGSRPSAAARSGVRVTFFWDKARGSPSSEPCTQSSWELWWGVAFPSSMRPVAFIPSGSHTYPKTSSRDKEQAMLFL